MKRYFNCFFCLTGNLITFGILLILICRFGTTEDGLIAGGICLILGGIAAFLSHLAAKDHPAVWGLSVLLFGASKGACAASLLLHYGMVQWAEKAPQALAVRLGISAGTVVGLFLLFGLLLFIPAVRRHRKAVCLPLLAGLLVAVIVLAANVREAFTVILLLNSITLVLSCFPGLAEGDDCGELRMYLSIASAMYALILLVIVLLIVCAALGGDSCDCDGDCCEGCCDGCDCGGGERKGRK